ncbi:hypothetical protein [Ensifer soli]|uniref:hypothetical protein n=1 Tax=Ciceribacter sp. sgz301302 TaxID=3342379 RepID=UPI0035B77C1B
MAVTKDNIFKPAKSSAEQKASSTDTAARQIVLAEAAERVRKTESLRKLREAREAEAPSIAAPPSRAARKKAAKA